MKAALKLIMTVTGLALIGVNIGVVLLLTRFEGLLREGLTYQAGEILDADVDLEAVRLDWAEQALVFKGVSIHNPESFSDREAFRIDSLLVRPDLLTIFAKTPAVREVVLTGAELHLQYIEGSGTNLGAMMESARNWAGEQRSGERRRWGRPITLDSVRADVAQVEVRQKDAGAAATEFSLAAFTTEPSLEDEAVSGARVMQVILQCLARQLAVDSALAPSIRTMLLSEVEPSAA